MQNFHPRVIVSGRGRHRIHRMRPNAAACRGPLQTVSNEGGNPFGGMPAVEIPDDAHAMSAFLKAEVAMNEGDREEALSNYEQAVKYDPSSAELRVQLATLYVRSGRLKDALEQVNRAIADKPNQPDALLLGAGINSALGNDDAAEQDYKAVLRADPKNQEAYLYLGTLYAKRGDYTNAESTFKTLIKLDPNSFLGYYYAGRVMVAAKNYPAAENYYTKALALNPQSELVLLDIAMLREIEGKPKQSEEYYNKVLQVNPNNQQALKLLAQLHVGQKNFESAIGDLKKLEGTETNPADTRMKIGLLYLERGDTTAPPPSSTWCSDRSPTTTGSITIWAPLIPSSTRLIRRSTSTTRFPIRANIMSNRACSSPISTTRPTNTTTR